MDPHLAQSIMTMALKIGLVLGPIFVAFYRKDRDAFQRLLTAVPAIYESVMQERRRIAEGKAAELPAGAQKARTDPLGRALEKAAEQNKGKLTAVQEARLRTEFQAMHERNTARVKSLPK
jgi:hypothetical protein